MGFVIRSFIISNVCGGLQYYGKDIFISWLKRMTFTDQGSFLCYSFFIFTDII